MTVRVLDTYSKSIRRGKIMRSTNTFEKNQAAPSTSFSPLNSPLPALLELLHQPTLPELLRLSLSLLMQSCTRAEGATVYFYAASPSIRQQIGHLTPEAKGIIEQWESTLFSRSEHTPSDAELTSQAILSSRHTLIELLLPSPEMNLGHVVLFLRPNLRLERETINQLHQLCAVTGHVAHLRLDLLQTRQRLKRLRAFNEIMQALTSSLDLKNVLGETMSLAATLMGANSSSLMLVDEENPNYLNFAIIHGDKGAELLRYRLPRSEGIAGWVATNAQAVIVNEPRDDERFSQRMDMQTGFLTQNLICVPMKINGDVIGVLQALNKAGGFNEEDQELLSTLANQAAIAIVNARLYRDLREERDRIIEAEEKVRRELSRNLHDGPVQRMAAMSMSIDYLKMLVKKKPEALTPELEELAKLNQRAILEARTLLFELRPVVLQTQGLVAALQAYVERLNKTGYLNRAKVTLSFPTSIPRLEPKVEQTLFAIVQEAVTNARKHAKAKEISVQAYQKKNFLYLFIRDNGVGFDVRKMYREYEISGSLGMINMRERANLIDAKWHIASQPRRGTQVSLQVPLKPITTETL